MKMKKKIVLVLLVVFTLVGVVACGNVNNKIFSGNGIAIDNSNLPDKVAAVYMGGLYARSETNDMMLGFYKKDGEPVVVITEYGNTYFGSYITEDAKLEDGTKYTKMNVQDKIYGYHFNEDMTGILVDQEGNKYEAKQLDVSVASDMLISALRENQ